MSQLKKSEIESERAKTIFRDDYRKMINELRTVRKNLGLTQTEVARQAGWADHTYLVKIEKYQKRLDVVELALLCKVYRKSPAYFMKFLKF